MKKLVLGILLLLCGASYGQTIIPRAGLVLSNVSSEENDESFGETKSRIGFTIGAAFNFPVSEVFSLQPELNYIQKGAKADLDYSESFGDESIEISGKSQLSLDYLEIPVLARFTFGASDTKFFMTAGPSFGIGLGGKIKMDADIRYEFGGEVYNESMSQSGKVKFEDEPEEMDEEDFNAYIEKRVDFGAQFGAGVLIKGKFMIDLRYGLGLTELTSSDKMKNRAVQLSFGMPFSLGK